MNDEKKIYEALYAHHENVKQRGFSPVMTVLVGSQNYDLATESSDYDTFTFILPTLKDIATLKNPVSKTYDGEDGHINIKDIRLALNLLRKTNPNSVECFATKYKKTEEGYEWMHAFPPYALRCDSQNMMDAIGGMAHQMSKRNMTPGKRLAHILRMHCMVYRYMDIDADILSMTGEEHRLATKAKLDPDNPKWLPLCEEWEKVVQNDVKSVDVHYFDKIAVYADSFITELQKLFTASAAR